MKNIQLHSNAQRKNSNPAWGHERTRGWVHSPSMANRCSAWSPCLESAFTSLVIKCKKHIKKRAGCLPLLGRRALPVRFRKLCVWLLWMAFSSRSRSNGFNICGGHVWGCWRVGGVLISLNSEVAKCDSPGLSKMNEAWCWVCPVKGRNGERSPHQQLSRMGEHFRRRRGGGGSFLVEIWGLAGEKQ